MSKAGAPSPPPSTRPSASPLILVCADATFDDLLHLRHLDLIEAVWLGALREGPGEPWAGSGQGARQAGQVPA